MEKKWTVSSSEVLTELQVVTGPEQKAEISVKIHTNLTATNYSIGYNAPTCFDCKPQPSSGSCKCLTQAQCVIQVAKHEW